MKSNISPEEPCQLNKIYENREEFSSPLGRFDKIYLKFLRLADAINRRIIKILKKKYTAPVVISDAGITMDTIMEGDLVEVRSLDEIQKTLVNDKTKGLQFLPGMSRYAGTRAVVLRRVNIIFDEQIRSFRKCNSVILTDVICDGHDMFNKTGCDRCCYFFWKDEWLKKIS